MRFFVSFILWHNRLEIFSIDFQKDKDRLVTAGADCLAKIWKWTKTSKGDIQIDFLSALKYHKQPINVVRFSPTDKECLATAGDDGEIIIWKLNTSKSLNKEAYSEDPDLCYNKEFWTSVRKFSGPRDGIQDICWSPDSFFLLSASVDHSIIIWDCREASEPKVKEVICHSHYVQGVSWDPLNEFFISQSSDETCKIHSLPEKLVVSNAGPPVPVELVNDYAYLDDSLPSFFRRPCWSPDGSLIFTPCGKIKDSTQKEKTSNENIESSESFTTYVCTRKNPVKPLIHYPSPDSPSVVVKCNPLLFQSSEPITPLFDLPYRIIFAIATLDSICIYDTEHIHPLAIISNPHYDCITDMTWSSDGYVLAISSQDGYCSFLIFTENDLGKPLTGQQNKGRRK